MEKRKRRGWERKGRKGKRGWVHVKGGWYGVADGGVYAAMYGSVD